MVSVAYCDSGDILRPLAGHDALLHCDCFLNDIGGEQGERRSKHFSYHLLVRSSQPQPSITLLIIEAGFITWITIAVGESEEERLHDIDKIHTGIFFLSEYREKGRIRRKRNKADREKDYTLKSERMML